MKAYASPDGTAQQAMASTTTPSTYDNEYADGMSRIAQLLSFGQSDRNRGDGSDAARMCAELVTLMDGQAQLVLGPQARPAQPDTTLAGVATSFAVRFGQHRYGTLWVSHHPARPQVPAIPLVEAYLLAEVCGHLLYTIDVSTFLSQLTNHISSPVSIHLTDREREVLSLMSRRLSEAEIARKLYITKETVRKHRQHIYQKLGVRNEYDAILAGYRAGLLSAIEDK
jgi:DNA-binding CsgD family transcriptional regulator